MRTIFALSLLAATTAQAFTVHYPSGLTLVCTAKRACRHCAVKSITICHGHIRRAPLGLIAQDCPLPPSSPLGSFVR